MAFAICTYNPAKSIHSSASTFILGWGRGVARFSDAQPAPRLACRPLLLNKASYSNESHVLLYAGSPWPVAERMDQCRQRTEEFERACVDSKVGNFGCSATSRAPFLFQQHCERQISDFGYYQTDTGRIAVLHAVARF